MKPKPKKEATLIFLSIVLILFVAILVNVNTDNRYITEEHPVFISKHYEPQSATPILVLSPRSIYKDALLLVEVIEANHPIFLMRDMLADYYEERKAEFLEFAALADRCEDFDISNPRHREEFELAIYRYLSLLQDGHTALTNRNYSSIMITEDWFVQDSRLFLVRDNITSEIIEIGGAAIADIFYQVDRHFFSENEVDRRRNHEIHSRRRGILLKAGAEELAGNNIRMEMTLKRDGQISKEIAILQWGNPQFFCGSDWFPGFTIRHSQIDDIFIIDLRRFQLHEPYHSSTIAAIERAIEDGVRSFIVDLRGNIGGNSLVGIQLLSAMGVTPPGFGVISAAGPLSEYQLVQISQPTSTLASNRYNISLVVLIDSYSYSSSMMFAAWIRDGTSWIHGGSLGTIIGEPSRQAPNAFGNWSLRTTTLQYSGFSVIISQSWFTRPDTSADPTILLPDIIVESRYALDVALDYLRNK